MRLTLNTLVGVILLILSIFLAFIIGTKFFNKQDPCLNSFFYLYQTINKLNNNSYVEITLYPNKECLIAYYPKTALLFNEEFFDDLQDNRDNKIIFDFYRSLLKYPLSYGCNDLSNLEGCGDFNNFYALYNKSYNLKEIFSKFISANLRLAMSIGVFASPYLVRLFWKISIEFIRKKLIEEIGEKIEEKLIKSTVRRLVIFVSSVVSDVVLTLNPLGFILNGFFAAMEVYSTYQFFKAIKELYNTWQNVKLFYEDYMFFWNNKFLKFIINSEGNFVKKFFLDDKSRILLKEKEGSLIYCKIKNNVCNFDGIYFKKLKSYYYLSNSLALIYPVFFENALVFSSSEKYVPKQYYLFNLNLADNKNLIVLMDKNNPYSLEALSFFKLLKNKDLLGLSKKPYLDIVIEKEKKRLKLYLLFYGLVDKSKFLNTGSPLVVDSGLNLTYYFDENVLGTIKQNLEQSSGKNPVVVSIENGILKIQNEKRLYSFYKNISKELNNCFNEFIHNDVLFNLKEFEIYFFDNVDDKNIKKDDNSSYYFIYSFVKEKFYKYFIISYLLEKNNKFKNIKKTCADKQKDFINLFNLLLNNIDKSNYYSFSKKFDILMIIYLINGKLDIGLIKDVSYSTDFKIEDFLTKTGDKEVLDYLISNLENIFYSYDIKKQKVDFYSSLNNIFYYLSIKRTKNTKENNESYFKWVGHLDKVWNNSSHFYNSP